jgi:hypothetical protein
MSNPICFLLSIFEKRWRNFILLEMMILLLKMEKFREKKARKANFSNIFNFKTVMR